MQLKDFVNLKLASADKEASAEGVPLVLNNCKKYKKMRDLKVYGNCFQDGTPSPENPIEVQCVGEKSVNLLREDLIPASSSSTGITCDYEGNGVFHIHGEYTNNGSDTVGIHCVDIPMNIPIEADSYYTVYAKKISGSSNAEYYPYFGVKSNDVSHKNWLNVTIPKEATDGQLFKSYARGNYTLQDAHSTSRFWIYTTCYAGITLTTDIRIQVWFVKGNTDDVPYEPYGKYKTPIIFRGINYFSMKKAKLPQKTINGITFTPLDDERMRITGKAIDTSVTTVYNQSFAERIPIKAGYYRASMFYNSDIMFRVTRNNNDWLVNLNRWGGSFDVDGYVSQLYIGIPPNTTQEFDDIYEAQLVKGSTPLPYEPYVEPITTNIYLDEPLGKADYIDFKNSMVIRNINALNLGDLTYRRNKYGSVYLFYAVVNGFDWKYTAGVNGSLETFCEKYSSYTQEYANTQNYSLFVGNAGFQVNCIGIRNDDYTDVNAFKASLADTVVYYTLAEPKEEPLNLELPKLNAKTTIIEVETSLAPSNISGKYILR